ncbi:hypothetical protein PAHAL_5G185300 [Panicum hallii]|jgi:hypothetical protein|uniref:Uncharacterized protein n=1 Tax=Panicum hallii TaxID=206008 RepID=A0A2T8IKD6_9POAL|nr:hypothetical protein PAHAL_5G185300 [Panicum hallii]
MPSVSNRAKGEGGNFAQDSRIWNGQSHLESTPTGGPKALEPRRAHHRACGWILGTKKAKCQISIALAMQWPAQRHRQHQRSLPPKKDPAIQVKKKEWSALPTTLKTEPEQEKKRNLKTIRGRNKQRQGKNEQHGAKKQLRARSREEASREADESSNLPKRNRGRMGAGTCRGEGKEMALVGGAERSQVGPSREKKRRLVAH